MNKSGSPYMILVSIIFFGGIGYLEGAQEVPDLPLVGAPTGTGLAQPRGSERVKTQMTLVTWCQILKSVTWCNFEPL